MIPIASVVNRVCSEQGLEDSANEEVRTQIRIFLDQKDEDAEEFGHHYDNIRIEMEYPFSENCIV